MICVNPLLERLREAPLVGDGAMGTELLARGLRQGECPELWNAEHPELVGEVCAAYVAAGADVISTNTFGGCPLKLRRFALEERAAELNRRGVEIAVRAADGKALVWASMGPSGMLLEPLGEVSLAQAVDAFRVQAEAQAAGGAQAILVETMSSLEELRAAVEGARQACELPVFCTMSFGPGGRTAFGVTPEQLARCAEELGCAGVGVNCGEGLDENLAVLRELARHTTLPLIIQANAGKPQVVEGKTVYPAGPEEMARYAVQFVQAGAAVVGACCGSTPEHIRAIAQALRR